MSKLLVVFGATGNQGGAVVESVLHDAALSREYAVRAVTRDPSKPAAQALRDTGRVEVVAGDFDDAASLKKALHGAHTVFIVTVTVYGERPEERERTAGKNVADAAVAAGAQFLIFSTLPHVGRASKGRLDKCGLFDCKADIEEYIRSLPVKSAFLAPAWFMQNFGLTMKPQPAGDGTFVMANVMSRQTTMPLINAKDSGKFVAAILLAGPEKFAGKVLPAATGMYSMEEMARIMSENSGKRVIYKQVSEDHLRKSLPEPMRDCFVHMFLFARDHGYYGPESEREVAWAVAQARGKLTTLDDFFATYPLELD